jgi:MFS family permease
VTAGALLAAGSVLLTLLTPTTPLWQVLGTFFLFGCGFGLVNAPITTSAVSGMPRERAGAASAVASTSRQLGVSLGVAISGSVAGSAVAASGVTFTDAIAPLWWITAGFAVAILALGVVSTTAWAHRTTERIAFLFGDEASGSQPVARIPERV